LAIVLRLMRRRSRTGGISRAEIVTGERLQGLAEISIVPGHVRRFHRHVQRYARDIVTFESYDELGPSDFQRLSSKRSLFVYTHELEGFIEHIWPRLEANRYVLITHNSDYEVGGEYLPWIEAAGAKLTRWFAQNATVAHPKLVPLPIGVANRMWEHGDLRVLERAIARQRARPKTKNLYMHFNTKTHPEREEVRRVLTGALPDLAQSSPGPQGFAAYLDELSRHRFCVCPRGNGIDTHRVWECLYLEVIPIVERSEHAEGWRSRGLPLLVVDRWEELTPALLDAAEPALTAQPAVREPLLLSHYAALMSAALQDATPSRT